MPQDVEQTLAGDNLTPSSLEDIRQFIDSTVESCVALLPVRLIDLVHRRLVSRSELAHTVRAKMTLELESFAMMTRSDLEVLLLKRLTSDLRYAVLSHRWCASEPSLEDAMTHVSEWLPGHLSLASEASAVETHPDPGVQKLVMFCKTARSLGCRLAWMDTCCIDKTSSAEYEESINSMYSWYRRAHVCIVHFAQTGLRREGAVVSRSPSGHIKYVLGGSDVEPSVCDLNGAPGWKDEWFSRGWTLQELLAPRAIKFYSVGWEELVSGSPNHKNHLGLLKLLHSATGIPVDAIHEFNPTDSYTFAQKMRWASQRGTRREEDQAYCMLGLLGLNMPILYGEGVDGAFFRLQIEFMRVSSDQSIFSWHGHPLSRNSLLASHPAYFRKQTPCIERYPYSEIQYYRMAYIFVLWTCFSPAVIIYPEIAAVSSFVVDGITVSWAALLLSIRMLSLAREMGKRFIEFTRRVVGVGLHWAIPPSDLGFTFTNAGIRIKHDFLDTKAVVDHESSIDTSDGQKQWKDYVLSISFFNCVGVRVKPDEITEENRKALAVAVFGDTLILLKPVRVRDGRQSDVWVRIQTEKPIRGLHRRDHGRSRLRVVYIQ
jgi:Heterokaryon incompatibility protein (HET)